MMGMLIAGATIMFVGMVMGYGLGTAKEKNQTKFQSMEEKNRNYLKSVD